jgi:hypothetical protein
MTDTGTRQQHRGRPQTHGITALRGTVEGLGNRVVSRRTKVGRALHRWRMELLDGLGGIEAVSTQELAYMTDLSTQG